jgi:hypothetical protein
VDFGRSGFPVEESVRRAKPIFDHDLPERTSFCVVPSLRLEVRAADWYASHSTCKTDAYM